MEKKELKERKFDKDASNFFLLLSIKTVEEEYEWEYTLFEVNELFIFLKKIKKENVDFLKKLTLLDFLRDWEIAFKTKTFGYVLILEFKLKNKLELLREYVKYFFKKNFLILNEEDIENIKELIDDKKWINNFKSIGGFSKKINNFFVFLKNYDILNKMRERDFEEMEFKVHPDEGYYKYLKKDIENIRKLRNFIAHENSIFLFCEVNNFWGYKERGKLIEFIKESKNETLDSFSKELRTKNFSLDEEVLNIINMIEKFLIKN